MAAHAIEHGAYLFACLRRCVVAELVICHIGIRTYHCHALERFAQRQYAVVLEQCYALACHFASHFAVLLAAHCLGCLGGVDVGVFE